MTVDLLLERADLLLAQGRFRDAESHIRQALEQDPRNDEALALLGRCYLNNKQFDKGLQAVQQAVSIDPNNSFYYYLLGYGHYQKNELHEAATYLRKAIEINPYAAEFFGLLAFVLIDEKEFEQALQKSNEGLALAADNLTCLNARATALNKLRRTEDAIATMSTALAQDPDNQTTHTTVGWNLLERGRHQEARHHFMEALRIDPNYSSARIGLKEALKSKVLLYKWLLQYSFWIQNKGRNFQVALPIILYITFRVLISASRGTNEGLTWILVGTYIFIVVISWTIGSIANFTLFFDKTGKYALTHSERWAAINVIAALASGIGLLATALAGAASGTIYESGLFFSGLVALSMALPLGQIEYPIKRGSRGWKSWLALGLVGWGLLSLVCFVVVPEIALTLFIVYAVAFMIYNWSGITGRG